MAEKKRGGFMRIVLILVVVLVALGALGSLAGRSGSQGSSSSSSSTSVSSSASVSSQAASSQSGSSAASKSGNVSSDSLKDYIGKPLIEVCKQLESDGVDFTLIHSVSGMDMTSAYVYGDFNDGDMKVVDATADSSGKVTLKIISAEAQAASAAKASSRSALESKLDVYDAWDTAAWYGRQQYGPSFHLDGQYGNNILAEEADDENTWFLKSTCHYDGSGDLNCEAQVSIASGEPEVIYFVVY